MKKMYIFFALSMSVLLVASCSSGNRKETNTDTSAVNRLINSGGYSADTAYRKGATLIVANDCFTCHDINNKSTGPSYVDIANKYHNYQGVVENLSHAIIFGSKGVWGDAEMTPHPNITNADAQEMVKFILSLKRNA